MATIKILKDRIIAILKTKDWYKEGPGWVCTVSNRKYLYYNRDNEIQFNNPITGEDITIKLTASEASGFIDQIKANRDQSQKAFIESVVTELGGSIE